MKAKKKDTWTLKFIAYKRASEKWSELLAKLIKEGTRQGKARLLKEMAKASAREEMLFCALCKELEED